jgi:hypothetical protein
VDPQDSAKPAPFFALTLIKTVPCEGTQLIVTFLPLTINTLLSLELPYVAPLKTRTLYSEMQLPPSYGGSHDRTSQEDIRMLLTCPGTVNTSAGHSAHDGQVISGQGGRAGHSGQYTGPGHEIGGGQVGVGVAGQDT